jgi:hypothetical protein
MLLAGAACLSAGTAWVYPPAGLVVAGLLLVAAGWIDGAAGSASPDVSKPTPTAGGE